MAYSIGVKRANSHIIRYNNLHRNVHGNTLEKIRQKRIKKNGKRLRHLRPISARHLHTLPQRSHDKKISQATNNGSILQVVYQITRKDCMLDESQFVFFIFF